MVYTWDWTSAWSVDVIGGSLPFSLLTLLVFVSVIKKHERFSSLFKRTLYIEVWLFWSLSLPSLNSLVKTYASPIYRRKEEECVFKGYSPLTLKFLESYLKMWLKFKSARQKKWFHLDKEKRPFSDQNGLFLFHFPSLLGLPQRRWT